MKDKNVLFVLGAGASIPFGFPSGKELIEKIPRLLMPIEERFNKYLRSKYDNDLILNLYNKIRITPISSIDRFLANHDQDKAIQEIGKLCIAYSINQSENDSILTDKKDNWYAYLFNKLLELANNKPEDIVNLPIHFATFNYDRSLEYFIFRAFESSFSITSAAAKAMASDYISKRIIHIHGSLGDIFENDYKVIQGGFEKIEPMAKSIRIVHEDDNNEVLRRIQDILSYSNLVYFIGFGFAKENIKKLWFPRDSRMLKELVVKSSRYGIKLGELNDIKINCLESKGLEIDFFEREASIPWDLTPYQFMRNCVSLL